VVAVLVGRDVVLSLTLPVLRHHGHGPLPVHDLGKAATLCLLYAFPLLLLADNVQGWSQAVAGAFAVALTGWGVTLYLWSAVLYLLTSFKFGSQCAAKQANPRQHTDNPIGSVTLDWPICTPSPLASMSRLRHPFLLPC
jgi:phosphatidylglycerophosphate synthase